MQKLMLIFMFFLILSFNTTIHAKTSKGEIKEVIGEGEITISEMTPEKAWTKVKMRAMLNAIEKVAPIDLHGTAILKSGRLLIEYIMAFTKAHILEKKIIEVKPWFEEDKTPPIPHYKVRIKAKVFIPEKKNTEEKNNCPNFKASLNKVIRVKFENEEKAKLEPVPESPEYLFLDNDEATILITAHEDIYVSVFDFKVKEDKVCKLYPNLNMPIKEIKAGETLRIPYDFDPRIQLIMSPPGMGAFFIISVPSKRKYVFDRFLEKFVYEKEYPDTEFFKKYSEIAEYACYCLLPYEIKIKEE